MTVPILDTGVSNSQLFSVDLCFTEVFHVSAPNLRDAQTEMMEIQISQRHAR